MLPLESCASSEISLQVFRYGQSRPCQLVWHRELVSNQPCIPKYASRSHPAIASQGVTLLPVTDTTMPAVLNPRRRHGFFQMPLAGCFHVFSIHAALTPACHPCHAWLRPGASPSAARGCAAAPRWALSAPAGSLAPCCTCTCAAVAGSTLLFSDAFHALSMAAA